MTKLIFPYIVTFTIFFTVSPSRAQSWPHVFNFYPGSYGWDIRQVYDKSYIVTGNIVFGSTIKMGVICKVDVNGNILWYRIIGNLNETAGLKESAKTSDNGLISTGWTQKLDPFGDILILKTDVCGNKDWCKIYEVPNDVDEGINSIQLSNGNYVILVSCFGYDIVYQRVWLFYLDSTGNTIWQKVYCQNDPKFMSPIPNQVILDTDSSFLITGLTYYEDTLVPDLYWVEPFFVKVDLAGNELWAKPWTYNTNAFIGYAINSLKDSHGSYYSCGVRYHAGTGNIIAPCILKTSSSGQALAHYELLDHPTQHGVASTINQVSENELITSYRYTGPDNIDHIMAARIDTLGNILQEKELIQNENAASQSIITHDQKILITAGHYINGWKMYLYKLNFNLEYDSLDPHIYNYDSLCPNPVYADTLDLDCDVIVDVQEPQLHPEKSCLNLSPNPAHDVLNISIPPYYTSTNQSGSYTIYTTWYTYPDDLELEIYDLNGRKTATYQLAAQQKAITIPIGQYQPGMFIVRLMSHGKQLTQGKFIKE